MDADTVEMDQELTTEAIKVFDQMKATANNEFMTRIHVIVEDLGRRARHAVEKIAIKKKNAEEAGVPWIPTQELQRLTQDQDSVLRSDDDLAGLSAFDSQPGTNTGGIPNLFAGNTGSPFQHQDWVYSDLTNPFGTSMGYGNAHSFADDVAVTSAAADPRAGLMFLG
ncbi:hypothetical protein UCRPA7_5035 [Phaeoacremonium minimum UCRPA7]|uniref:Uncharacterized protein n=1 Tax=Phaeoacremonium minimum (strain UCR-PA7) TaxID=1286976 RepID=R8BJC8_PHAM7|nr:hypothetical protein UCRPA7_5035 [Phaeoacremonium minimum UCRPA7]EON99448.1 hypothetical protein UCRPA7_5035 [Phaeoacremonium minimum UCRPA7]